MLREAFRFIVFSFFILACFSKQCNENDISEDVYDVVSAVKLASTVACEDGFFSVRWNGSVKIFDSIYVGENTTLHILGISNAALDGSGITQLFSVGRNSTLNLVDILLTGGFAKFGGAVFLDSGSKLYLKNCDFFKNNAFTAGAAIYASEYAMLDIYRTHFRNNSAILYDNNKVEGGAIFAGSYSYLYIVECNFIGNAAVHYANIPASTIFDDSNCIWFFHEQTIISSCCTLLYDFSPNVAVSSSSSTAGLYVYISYSNSFGSRSKYSFHSSSSSATQIGSYHEHFIDSDLDSTELSSGGAIAVQSFCVLDIFRSLFKFNTADYGGAIAVIGESSLFSIVKTEFVNNHAMQSGGAIFISNKNSESSWVSESTFRCNLAANLDDFTSGNRSTSSNGGAVSIKSSPGSKVTIKSTEFFKNSADGVGGGIDSQESLDIIGCNVSKNFARNGGFMSMSGDVLQITTTSITENWAEFSGGGIYIFSKNIAISYSNFSQNYVTNHGGSIYIDSSISVQVNISTTIFQNEYADRGGALYINGNSVISLLDSHFILNRANRYGGAIYANIATQIKVVNTFFKSNKSYLGGAIWSNGNLTFEYCNGTKNEAVSLGGFLHLGYGASAEISNSHFLGNQGYQGGGIYFEDGSHASIHDVIFEANYAAQAGVAIFTYSSHLDVALENVIFNSSEASCCHANGIRIQWGSTFSCVDVDIGSGTSSCCTASQFVVNLLSKTCSDCGSAYQCNELGLSVSMLTVSPGYWRESIYASKATACPYKNACIGGLAYIDSSEYCAEGYEGPLCALCSPGYIFVMGNSCIKCGDGMGAVTTTLIVVIALFLCLVIFLVLVTLLDIGYVPDAIEVFRAQHITYRIRQILSRMPFEKLQEAYIVLTILMQYASVTGFELPEAYATFIRSISIINFDMRWVAAPSCSFHVGFYTKLLLATLIPLVFLLVLAITYKICLRKICKARLDAEKFRNASEQSRSKHIFVALVLLYIVYSTVSTVILETFECDVVNHGKLRYGLFESIGHEKFLRADYATSCNTLAYFYYRIYAVFMMLVYPIGIPVLYLYLLWGVRDKLKKIPESNRDYLYLDHDIRSSSFLWKKYRKSMWWWEIIECIRRIMLASSLIFILPGTTEQAVISAIFATLSMAFFGIAKPIIDFYDTQVYGLGCFILFGTFFSSLLLKLNFAKADDLSQVFVSTILIALNVLLIGAATWQLVSGYKMAKRGGNLKQNSFFSMCYMDEEHACTALQSIEYTKLSNHIRSRSF